MAPYLPVHEGYQNPAQTFLFSVQKHEDEKGRTSGKRQVKRLLSVRAKSLYTEGHEQRTQAA